MKNILIYVYLLFWSINTKTDAFIFNKFNNIKKSLNQHNLNNDIEENKFYRLGINPTLKEPNQAGELTWYIIGLPKDFKINKSNVITIRDINYIVWKDINNHYYVYI